MAKRHCVLFLEDPLPGSAPALDISEPWPNLFRAVPRLPGAASSDDPRVARLLAEAIDSHPSLAGRFDAPVQWFYSPMTAPCFLGAFEVIRAVVYDCMDELANFRFAPPDLGTREQFLIAHADIIFTGGYQLFEAKSRRHPNVRFYGCGVDMQHFSKARLDSTGIHEKLSSLPGPIFGYFGVVDERLDYELIAALADRFPRASIVMAGPLAKVEASQLPDRANLHWLGRIEYQELPALVKGFDVCLMPFALNEATRYINPTKTLEYMAAGKPIVSTAIADVIRNFAPVVAVARSGGEFMQAVEDAWLRPDAAMIDQGLVRARNASWDAIVECIEGDVQSVLHTPHASASAGRSGLSGLE